MSDRVLLGQFGAAHGIRGEVRVNSFTEDPLGIAGYGPFTLDDGRVVEIAGVRKQGDSIIARVKGIADRNGAETLRNRELYVDRSALPEIDEEDDFYQADLIGLRVELEDGTLHGKIISVLNFGAGDLLEIEPVGGARSFYLPFTRAIVPVVDVKLGRIVVIPPPEAAVEPGEEEQGDGAGEDEAS
jgi:16S rRNA processing protein RimM